MGGVDQAPNGIGWMRAHCVQKLLSRFRKIRRKRKEREEAKTHGEDEDKGSTLLEKAERLRAQVQLTKKEDMLSKLEDNRLFLQRFCLMQERATLKHTRKSKWAKEQLSRNHRDPAVGCLQSCHKVKSFLSMQSGDARQMQELIQFCLAR